MTLGDSAAMTLGISLAAMTLSNSFAAPSDSAAITLGISARPPRGCGSGLARSSQTHGAPSRIASRDSLHSTLILGGVVDILDSSMLINGVHVEDYSSLIYFLSGCFLRSTLFTSGGSLLTLCSTLFTSRVLADRFLSGGGVVPSPVIGAASGAVGASGAVTSESAAGHAP